MSPTKGAQSEPQTPPLGPFLFETLNDILKHIFVDHLIRYPVLSFFILAYGIAWIFIAFGHITGLDFFVGIGFFVPALSAIIVTGANQGKEGIQALISRLLLWRVEIKWYLIALLAPIVFELMAILTHRILGETTLSLTLFDWVQIVISQFPWLIIILMFLLLSSTGEELGWRGYALPRLQEKYGSILASIILGILWGLWHLPAFWIPGSPQYGLPFPGYVIASIGYALIYTAIYNGTKGSVFVVSLYHGASNLTLIYGNVISPKTINDLYLSLPALAILVIVVILISGPSGLVSK